MDRDELALEVERILAETDPNAAMITEIRALKLADDPAAKLDEMLAPQPAGYTSVYRDMNSYVRQRLVELRDQLRED